MARVEVESRDKRGYRGYWTFLSPHNGHKTSQPLFGLRQMKIRLGLSTSALAHASNTFRTSLLPGSNATLDYKSEMVPRRSLLIPTSSPLRGSAL
jgi:hypothetical protein